MTEGMQSSLWIERGTIGRGKNHTRGSDRSAHRTRSNNAHACSPRRLVTRSGDNRRPLQQSCRFTPRGRYRAADFRRFIKRRQQCAINFQCAQDFP